MMAAAVVIVETVPSVAKGADWTAQVQRSRDGGYILGNPKAKVRIVEYGSLTCIYCAVFANADYKIMVAQHIATGKANFEFRYLARDRVDGAAGLLMRCVPTARYFEVLNHLFATQKSWYMNTRSKVSALNLTGKSNADRYKAVVKTTGLDVIFRKYGLNDARQASCLGDKAGMAALNRVADTAEATYDITGTPSFLVNGKVLDGNDWASIKIAVKKAGG